MKNLLLLVLLSCAVVIQAQSVDDLVSQGDAMDAKLKSEEALKWYLQAEPLAKGDATLLIKIAKQYGESMTGLTSDDAKRKAGENALAYAKRAVGLSPSMADAHLAVAICYGRLLDLVPARTRVEYSRLVKQGAEAAVKLDPKSDYAWHMLGRWHQAVATMSGFTKAIVKVVYGALPDASLDEAAKCFLKAIALKRDRVAHHIELGITYAEMQKAADARAAITEGLNLPNRERDDAVTKSRGQKALQSL